MKKLKAVFMLFSFSAALLLSTVTPVLATTWREYYDSEYDISFAIPKGWMATKKTIKETTDGKTVTKTVVTVCDPDGKAEVIFKKHCSYPEKSWGRDDIRLSKVTRIGNSDSYVVENGSNMAVYVVRNGWKPTTSEYTPVDFLPVISTYKGVCSFSSTEDIYPFVKKDELTSSEKELVRQILGSIGSGHVDLDEMNDEEDEDEDQDEDYDDEDEDEDEDSDEFYADFDQNSYCADGYYDPQGHWHDYTYER